MKNQTRGPYKPKIAPPDKTFGKRELITQEEATSFITSKLITNNGEWRATRDKVSKRVKYAVDNGQISFPNGKIAFGLLIAWARDKNDWKEQLSSFSATYTMDNEVNMNASSSVEDLILPGTMDACHENLKAVSDKLHSLEQQFLDSTTENSQLKTKAERYDEICRTNKNNGGKREM